MCDGTHIQRQWSAEYLECDSEEIDQLKTTLKESFSETDQLLIAIKLQMLELHSASARMIYDLVYLVLSGTIKRKHFEKQINFMHNKFPVIKISPSKIFLVLAHAFRSKNTCRDGTECEDNTCERYHKKIPCVWFNYSKCRNKRSCKKRHVNYIKTLFECDMHGDTYVVDTINIEIVKFVEGIYKFLDISGDLSWSALLKLCTGISSLKSYEICKPAIENYPPSHRLKVEKSGNGH